VIVLYELDLWVALGLGEVLCRPAPRERSEVPVEMRLVVVPGSRWTVASAGSLPVLRMSSSAYSNRASRATTFGRSDGFAAELFASVADYVGAGYAEWSTAPAIAAVAN
jgi:hypothetical protein